MRNALFRMAYMGTGPTAEQIRNGLVFQKTLTGLTHMSDAELHPVFEIAEHILQHWHIKYIDEWAFKHMRPKD